MGTRIGKTAKLLGLGPGTMHKLKREILAPWVIPWKGGGDRSQLPPP
jgi:hypothetical protein